VRKLFEAQIRSNHFDRKTAFQRVGGLYKPLLAQPGMGAAMENQLHPPFQLPQGNVHKFSHRFGLVCRFPGNFKPLLQCFDISLRHSFATRPSTCPFPPFAIETAPENEPLGASFPPLSLKNASPRQALCWYSTNHGEAPRALCASAPTATNNRAVDDIPGKCCRKWLEFNNLRKCCQSATFCSVQDFVPKARLLWANSEIILSLYTDRKTPIFQKCFVPPL
jgi:hypothetical protein